MQDTVFDEVLLAPRAHHNEVLTTASDDEWGSVHKFW